MQIFVSEYVCGGAWSEPYWPDSLATEGGSMLRAIVDDLARIPAVTVCTTWDHRLGAPPFSQPNVHASAIRHPAHELDCFQQFAATCHATLLIAPEFDGLLADRCRWVEQSGGRLLGPTAAAVELCTDKLRLADILRQHAVPTLETHPFASARTSVADLRFPCVIKPRDGAGSQDTYLVRTPEDYVRLLPELQSAARLRDAIWQPFFRGIPVSCGLLIDPHGNAEPLPPCEQRLSDDGRFVYRGGSLPARGDTAAAITTTALAACAIVDGLRGYVGVDLIVAQAQTGSSVTVVEINPRLTTSYLGYRALALDNLAERLLSPASTHAPLRWSPQRLSYDPTGRITPIAGLPATGL